MFKSDTRMTIYLAWAVRTALLALYIPVQILSTIVESTHRLDLWASAVVMQSTGPVGGCRSESASKGPQIFFAVDPPHPSAGIQPGL
jgi:hypothetical protein